MPRNAAGMMMMSRAKSSNRTTYHSKHRKNSNSGSSSLEEESMLAPGSTAFDHLETQLESRLVRYLFVDNVNSEVFKVFCQKFAESPVKFTRKMEMIHEIIALTKYNHYNLCVLLSYLPRACSNLAEFSEVILPLFIEEKGKATLRSEEYIIEDLLKSITHSLLNKLSVAELYKIFRLEINNKSIIQGIFDSHDHSGIMLQTIMAVYNSIVQCNQAQLKDATTIIKIRIRSKKDDRYVGIDPWILSSLLRLLLITANPKQIFDLSKEYPISNNSDYILKFIRFHSNALRAGIDRKEVKEEIKRLFTIQPKSKVMLFNSVVKGERGKTLFYLIEEKLLPRDLVLSNDDKDLVFDYIMSKVPAEKRNIILTDLSNHSESRLNQYLWPKPGRFSFFGSQPKLPERWISAIQQVVEIVDSDDQLKLEHA